MALPAEASRLRLVSWSEMTASPVEPVRYDWHGWVARATVTLIAGAGESLKSWLALYMAIMRAAGRAPFDDAEGEVPPAGPVIIFSAENALQEDQRRCGLLKAGLELPEELPLTFIPAEHFCFRNDVDYAEVEGVVARIQPVAIIIDSAIAISGLEQENDNAAVRDFMKRRIMPLSRKHGATVSLIVHSPKPSLQPGSRFTDEHVVRGAGDWRNAADTVLYLRRDATLGRLAVVVKHGKHRSGPKHAPMWFTLEDVIPNKAVRLVYGGSYDDESGQGEAAGLMRAVLTLVDALKASLSGCYVKGLLDQVIAGGISKASARRALDIVRGKRPWPGGALRGRKQAVVEEDKHGKRVFLTFLAAQWPAEVDDDA